MTTEKIKLDPRNNPEDFEFIRESLVELRAQSYDDRTPEERQLDEDERSGKYKPLGCSHIPGGAMVAEGNFNGEEWTEAEAIKRQVRSKLTTGQVALILRAIRERDARA